MEKVAASKTKYEKLSHAELMALVVRYEQENFLLRYQLFARKKEWQKLDPINMRLLFNEAEEVALLPENEEVPPSAPAKSSNPAARRGKRRPLPEKLPRERLEFDLSEEEKICAQHGVKKIKIGENISEQLVVVPATLKVRELVTFTYKCPCCSDEDQGGITKSAKPPQPIAKSLASPELLAFIATCKYEDALPLYRQEKIFERYQIDISRTSMARWMIEAAELCQPLLNLMHESMLAAKVLHCDETPVQVLKEEGRTAEQTSYMWALARRHENPVVFFSYYNNRSKAAASDLLLGFEGTLISDGLKTYDAAAREQNFTQAGCWAHARRKFFHAEKEERRGVKKGRLASSIAMSFIKNLYQIERELSGKPPDEIKAVRAERSQPILDGFHTWLLQQQSCVLPKSLLGKAISYALEQWPKLIQFCRDGLVAIDNNYIEAHIRPFVIGRNNWMFSASAAGAEASAALYTIIETAKVNSLNAYDYLCLIFKELPKAKELADFERLLPYNVTKHFTVMPYQSPR